MTEIMKQLYRTIIFFLNHDIVYVIMDPEKKLGIILIIIGLIIPLIVFPFVTGFSREKSFSDNFYNAGIKIGTAAEDNSPSQVPAKSEGAKTQVKVTWSMVLPRKIPFRYFLVPTVILIYMGIIRIDRARKRKLNM